MRLSSLRLLLSGCALVALAAPVAAQEAPVIIMDPPLIPRDTAPVIAPLGDDVRPEQPPAIVPVDDSVPAPDPTTPSAPETWSPAPFTAGGQSAYGLYLSGRVAGWRGDRTASADLFARSYQLAPEQPDLADEAFRAGLFAGDLDTVVQLAPQLGAEGILADAGQLSIVVDHLRQGRVQAAHAALARETFDEPYTHVSRYLAPVLAAAAGDRETALAPVRSDPAHPAGEWVLRDQRAQLLELHQRHDDADAEYRALLALPDTASLFGVGYGAFLERRGRSADAIAAYEAALAGSAPDPRALGALTRIRAGGRSPAQPTVQQIAADALDFASLEMTEFAETLAQPSQANLAAFYRENGAVLLRLAAALQTSDARDLRLGRIFAAVDQAPLAVEAFERVGRRNPIHYASAQIGLSGVLASQEREDEALEALRRADAAAPDQIQVTLRLATQLASTGRHGEALEVLNRPTINTTQQGVEVRYLRGVVLEQLDRIEEAEAELWAALQIAPDNPLLLNHLGYLWVDSGRRVEQGAEMISRAFAADPRNGTVQDSLGWAQYRRGQYETAVETLEQALAKQPADAEINDHLGDAYWRVGRIREAGWQWNRVLTLEPEPERRAEVEQKLSRGLPSPPVTGSQP
jgi:tetratricopeptide (TPR) repeat protein